MVLYDRERGRGKQASKQASKHTVSQHKHGEWRAWLGIARFASLRELGRLVSREPQMQRARFHELKTSRGR